VGPRVGPDAVARRKKSHHCCCRDLNPGRPARSLVSVLTELPRHLSAHSKKYKNVYSYLIAFLCYIRVKNFTSVCCGSATLCVSEGPLLE
jgi:hypothetical protein